MSPELREEWIEDRKRQWWTCEALVDKVVGKKNPCSTGTRPDDREEMRACGRVSSSHPLFGSLRASLTFLAFSRSAFLFAIARSVRLLFFDASFLRADLFFLRLHRTSTDSLETLQEGLLQASLVMDPLVSRVSFSFSTRRLSLSFSFVDDDAHRCLFYFSRLALRLASL